MECTERRATRPANDHSGPWQDRVTSARPLLVCLVQERKDCAVLQWVSPSQPDSQTPKASRATLTDSPSETRSWDVRTKRVTYDIVPTIDGVIGITNYGPTAALFTLGRNHTTQQYDINPMSVPLQVQSVQHVPANTPPTPPTTLEEQKNPYTGPPTLPTMSDAESSADDGEAMSPLQKIAREMDSLDQLESELRDKVTPLSPTSSRASSTSSRSSGGARHRNYLYDRPPSSKASASAGYQETEFSFNVPMSRHARDSMSIRSGSTRASQIRFRSSSLRKEILRSPEETKYTAMMDLFPFTKNRVRDVPLQTPHYGNVARTAEILQREMLSVVFGWNDTTESLIREELSQHRPGSASSVLLAKWVGDMGADNMASMVGAESMTSSDWMLLALSSIGEDSQKKVGEAFVQRLLEKGDVHPAVAILMGLGELNDAIEVYVSQGYHMEAVLLTCLHAPSDWQRQCYLLRKWGETAVRSGEPELAVRIFSCTSVETTEPWTSPRAQDAVFAARQMQQEELGGGDPLASPPLSPPSRSGSGRMTAKNASLKLITTFGDKGAPMSKATDDPTPLAAGVTPIVTSAMSLRADPAWPRPGRQATRDPSSARTATPGGFAKRNRLPSRDQILRTKQEAGAVSTPLTAARDFRSRAASSSRSQGRRTPSISDTEEPTTALRPTAFDHLKIASEPQAANRLPSPSRGFQHMRQASRSRQGSHSSQPDSLTVQIVETRYTPDALSPGPSTQNTAITGHSTLPEHSRAGAISPSVSGMSTRSAKAKAIDDYISSVEEARAVKRQGRAGSKARGESQSRGESRSRAESRPGRGSSRPRERSELRGRGAARYIKPPKKSPASPIPMSPEEIAEATSKEAASSEAERFYKLASPVEPISSERLAATHARRPSGDAMTLQRSTSRAAPRQQSPDRSVQQQGEDRGRSDLRVPGVAARSPSSPLPSAQQPEPKEESQETQSDGRRVRIRTQSLARDDLQSRRAASRSRARDASKARKPQSAVERTAPYTYGAHSAVEQSPASPTSPHSPAATVPRAQILSKKQLAAKELEERRLSLARRPSAPAFPLPSDLGAGRPAMFPRSHTELGNNPHSYMPPNSRSRTADPEVSAKYGKVSGTSTPSAPIGLPATPRAMRHPLYLGAEPESPPPVPGIPDSLSSLSGSLLSQMTGSNLSRINPSSLSGVSSSHISDQARSGAEDGVGPLLPSTVFGKQGPQAPVRSASVPLEQATLLFHPAYKASLPASNKRFSGGRGHVRKISPPEGTLPETQSEMSSIDQALHAAPNNDADVIIIEAGTDDDPIVLPELQHLAMPPPPPPPPPFHYRGQRNSTDLGGMVIEGNSSMTGTATSGTASDLSQAPYSFPQPMERASTASPHQHRRGHGSIGETFGSRMRGVADRMRSTSKSRAKSPPMLEAYTYKSPYETVLPSIPSPHQRRQDSRRAKSPYEMAMAEEQGEMPPPPPPPPAPPAPGSEGKLSETSVPPKSSSRSGYRHPKELRANMPPTSIQSGASEPSQTGFL